MTTRPSTIWREANEEESQLLASGRLDEEYAVMARLHPEELIHRTDEVLDTFEHEVAAFKHPSDEDVMDAIRRVVLALNIVDHHFGGDVYATEERDQLCEYIENVIKEAGVDLEALASRVGIPPDELTDEWRTW